MNKKRFVEFLFHNRVVLLGDFFTKSNRRTPYFLNFGKLYTGKNLRQLGRFYADKIRESVRLRDFPFPTVVFGPAYKGVPLSVATVMGLERYGEIAYCFNRKENKDHGDRGILVGKELDKGDRVVVIDDVVTSGISIRESIQIIRKRQAQVVGTVVAVDREEPVNKSFLRKKEKTTLSASEYLSQEYQIPVRPLITISEVFSLAFKYKLINKKDYLRSQAYLNDSKNNED